VIGIPIAFLFAQNLSLSFVPSLGYFVPWTLAMPANGDKFPSIAMNLMTGANVPTYSPLYVALAAIVLFIGLSLWIFQRQEL
jgi:hypothetical protein